MELGSGLGGARELDPPDVAAADLLEGHIGVVRNEGCTCGWIGSGAGACPWCQTGCSVHFTVTCYTGT